MERNSNYEKSRHQRFRDWCGARGQRISVFVLGWLLLGLTTSLQAAERYEFYNGVRGLAMGGASIAIVNDETSLLLNPAGLGKLRDYFGTLVDPEIHVSGKSTPYILGGGGYFDPNNILTNLTTNPGQHFHLKAQLFPSFVVPNFGFGVLANTAMDAEVSTDGTLFTMNYRKDVAYVLGYNLRLWDGRFKLGWNVRYVSRTEANEEIALPASNIDLATYEKSGSAIALDAGLILSAPWKWLPSLSIVGRDIGGTTFDIGSNVASQPNSVPATFDAAIALFPIGSPKVRYTWTAEYRDVLSTDPNEDSTRRLHTGLEVNMADLLFLRAGMNQRYWTAGVEFSMQRFQFQVASYGEEIGTIDTPKEDRRYVSKFVFRF